MQIGFATSDWSHTVVDADGNPAIGGAGHYRCSLPAAALAAVGHETVVGRPVYFKRQGVLGVARWDDSVVAPDLIVLQRWMGEQMDLCVLRARYEGQRVVNDVDDWFWGIPTTNRAFVATHPEVNPVSNVRHYQEVLGAGEAVIASTPYLAERLRQRLQVPVRVARNALDSWRWTPRVDTAGDRPTVGWVGGTGWRAGDLEVLQGIIGPFLIRHRLWFHHSGAHPDLPQAHEALGLESEMVDTLPMTTIEDYPSLFAPVDIGVVPLSAHPFNEAKSCIKGMEYAAAGVPFVASDLPEYRWLRDEHGIGRIARKPVEWTKHLTQLLDPEVRRREAAENRERVAALTPQSSSWVEALRISSPASVIR